MLNSTTKYGKLKVFLCTTTMIGSLPLLAVPASAQDNAANTSILDEIVVTARKREESILEVPGSISVISEVALDRQGVQDFEDLAFAVPNVLITENSNIAGRTGVTIRGIPGRAGIYVDDVFVGNGAGINTLLVDIAAVEVLRGPQGTLFGRNAMSGAINTITKRPGDELSGAIDLEAGEYGLFVARGSINGPISEGIAAKVSAGYRTRDTYAESGAAGRLKAEDSFLVAGQLKFDPSESVSIILNADYLDESNENAGLDVVRDFGQNGSVFAIGANDASPTDRLNPGQNVTNTADRELLNLWGRIEADLGFAQLTSITSHRDIDFLFTRDGDNSEFDLIRGVQPVDFQQFSQEIRLTSPNDGRNFDWMLGAYYFEDEENTSDANTIGNDSVIAVVPGFAPFLPPLATGGVAGVVTPNTLIANPVLTGFDPFLGVVLGALQAQGGQVGVQSTTASQENKSFAVWASGTYRPSNQWELTAGLRYTDEEQNASFSSSTNGSLLLPAFGVVDFPEFILPARKDDDISLMGSVSYFPNDDLTLYVSYAEGFRSGGYNTAPAGVPGTPAAEATDRAFESEIVKSYEAGFKSILANGRVSLNAAAFYAEYDDFQRAFLRATPAGFVNDTFNADAEILGLEADLTAQVTNDFFLTASYGFQDSEYVDYQNAPINSTQGFQTVDLSGEPLPFVPKHSFAVGGQYDIALKGPWGVRLTTDVQYRSSYRVTDTDGRDPEAFVGGSVIVNPSIGIVNEDKAMQLILRADNLFDEEFRTGVDFNTFDGTVGQSLSAPRVISVQFRKDF